MELLQLQYFLSVAGYRSFTKAANAMFVTQPTISKQIAMLEHELNTKLFLRGNQPLELTPEGQLLLEELPAVIEALYGVLGKISSYKNNLAGQLRIGIGSMMDFNALMPNFLRNFSSNHPNIQLLITNHPFRDLTALLGEGALDIIFTFSLEENVPQGFQRMTINRSGLSLYYSKSMPAAAKPDLRPEDFANETMLQMDSSPGYYETFSRRYGFPIKKIITTLEMEDLILYLESGLGYCIMGSSYRMHSIPNIGCLELDRFDISERVGTDTIWAENNTNQALHLFIEEIRRHLDDSGQ